MSKQAEWWQGVEKDYRPFFDVIPRRRTNEEVKYVIKKLHLKPGQKLLDCPCGFGRMAIPLAQKGVRVTGVDITPSYLDELRTTARRRGLKITALQADMRRITFRNEFDAAANLATSLGYFEEDRQNLLVIRKLYQALKPGGRFVLNIINRDWIIAHYEPRGWLKCRGVLLYDERRFDYARSINRSDWTFVKGGETHSYKVAIRMYSYHELIDMFEKVGFVDVEGFGSVKDEPIDRNKMMMWVLGTKPRR
jgi:SAM-dependent methyltransferase